MSDPAITLRRAARLIQDTVAEGEMFTASILAPLVVEAEKHKAAGRITELTSITDALNVLLFNHEQFGNVYREAD